MNTPNTPHVYAAINAVQSAMAKEGIAKTSKNTQQGYAFRGIDAVYSALAPHLAAQGLCILPRVLDRIVTEKETKSGGTLFYTVLTVEFDFVSMKDGSTHVIRTIGEAMDSGDKSTNKAMSAAYKYACFMAFSIPTEGDNDADAHTHEVAPRKAANGQETASAQHPDNPPHTAVKFFATDEQLDALELLAEQEAGKIVQANARRALKVANNESLFKEDAEKVIKRCKEEIAKAQAAK